MLIFSKDCTLAQDGNEASGCLVCSIARVAREGDDIPNVGDACGEHDEPLEAKSESTMRHRAILPQVHISCMPHTLSLAEKRMCGVNIELQPREHQAFRHDFA